MPYFGSLIVLSQQATPKVWPNEPVTTIVGICYHFTVLLVPVDLAF